MALKPEMLDVILPPSEKGSKKFLALLIGFLVIALSGQAFFNYLINPTGRFGTRHLIEWTKDDQRFYKVELLAKADPPPRILILGSSNSRNLDPAYVRQVFGIEAFNATVEVGSLQDYLTFTRYAVDDLKLPIQMLIIGLDSGSFIMDTNRVAHPANVPELRRHLRHPWWDFLKTRAYLWSPKQTQQSLTILYAALTESEEQKKLRWQLYPAKREYWDKNGFNPRLPGHDRDGVIAEKLKFYRNNTTLEPSHVRDFQVLADYAKSHGIRVILFIPPQTPRLTRALMDTPYPERLEELTSIVKESEIKGVVYCNLSHVSFRYRQFQDPSHPDRASCRLIIDALRQCLDSGGGR